MEQGAAFPDGISKRHLPRPGIPGLRWYMLAVLGAIIAAALLGVFGGGKNPVQEARSAAAVLTVKAPATLRNGEFFELRLRADARQALAKPAIAVSAEYWRDLTINTMIPAPVGERFDEGFYVFEFDPVEAGQNLEWKVDGQVNPLLFAGTAGAVELRDGERTVARLAMRMRVLP